jgi:glycosyltransferase involved in cell wall biosynthesis
LKILIVIPAYNEEECIVDVLDRIQRVDPSLDIVVIDDSSTDKTAQLVREHGSKVIHLPANMGIGGAVQTGFIYAVREGYDIVVQQDGDGQHDPAYIKDVIAPILRGEADCVVGSRYTKEDPDIDYKTPFFRKVGMVFSAFLLKMASGKLIRDTTSGFRALNFKAFEFFSREYPTDHPEAEALMMLLHKGFRIQEVPVKMKSRKTGTSSFDNFRAIQYPFRVIVGLLGILIKK